MSTTNGNHCDEIFKAVALMHSYPPPDLAGAGSVALPELDCRNALLTAVAELTPALRPVRHAARCLPRRPRAVSGGGPRPPALGQAGRGLRGDRAEPDHRRAGRAGGGQELSPGGDRALVALHPARQPGDHHRARPSPGGIGPLERDPPGASAASRRLVLGHDHLTAGYNSPQRLVVKMGTEWGALGFAAQYEEGFSGQHAGDLLVIVDEASGVAAPIWSAIHGLAASRLVVAGNPIRYDCHFRELHDLAVKGSTTITSVGISSLESPDARNDVSPVGMASRTFLNQMREIHGEESPWWRSNILGIFPGQESVRFLPSAWLDACTRESVPHDELWVDYPAGSAFMGVDIGGGVGADRSVVVVRNQKQVLAVFASEWHGVLDEARHRLEPIVVELARKWGVTPERLVYDKAGIGRSFGSYLASHGFDGGRGLLRRGQGGQALRQSPHRQRVRAQAPARSSSREPRPVLLRRHPRVAGPAPGAGRAPQSHDGDRGRPGQAGPRRQGSPRRSPAPLPRPAGCAPDDVHVLGPGVKNEEPMDQKLKIHELMTARQQRLLIENYALLTESASDLRERLQEWYDYYQPPSPGECELVEIAVMSSIQRRRVLSHQTEVVNHKIRTAVFDFDRAAEDEVERYRAMLATSPGAAVLGLKKSALGVRLLISRWERLERLLHEDGTLYGCDRNELINYQGARAIPTESLSESPAAYLTWLYCLMAQPAPKDKDFVAMGNPRWRPTALDDRDPLDWLGGKDVSRQILKDLCTRELESLRQRERHLRVNYEEPARDGAELRKQVLASPEGSLLLRHERAHELTYNRAYGALLKGRLQSLKTGRPPGAPDRVDDGGANHENGAVGPGPQADADVGRGGAGPTDASGRRGGAGDKQWHRRAGRPGGQHDQEGKRGEAEDG